MLLITIGLFTGAKHLFRNKAWIIMVTIGTLFLMDDIFPGVAISHFVWPIVIIAAGLIMMFGPNRRCRRNRWKQHWEQKMAHRMAHKYATLDPNTNPEDLLDSVSVFGHVKKNIISKHFKGGEVACVFGGAEINFLQADINGRVELEINHVFGGSKLLIPSNWKVIMTELVAVFGGIEDKRTVQADLIDESKVLILKGNVVFGGIEIKTY